MLLYTETLNISGLLIDSTGEYSAMSIPYFINCIVMDKKKEYIIRKIECLKDAICHCENNLQYIKRLQALKYWLLKLDVLLDNSNDRIYREYFYSDKGHSFFDRVCLSIADYQYGNKPFNY